MLRVRRTNNLLWLDTGWQRYPRDGEAYHLAMAASQTADRIAHEEDLGKIRGA